MTWDRELEKTGVAGYGEHGERINEGTLLGYEKPVQAPSLAVPTGPPQYQPFSNRDPNSGLFDTLSGITDQDMTFMRVKLLTMDPTLQYDPAMANQILNGFIGEAMRDPALFDQFMEEPSLALAQTSEEYLKMKTVRDLLRDTDSGGEYFGGALDLDAAITAAMDLYSKREGAIYSAGQLMFKTDVARGEWKKSNDEANLDDLVIQALSEKVEAQARELGIEYTPGDIRNLGAAGEWGDSYQEALGVVSALNNRGGGWVYDKSGTLLVTVTGTENDGQSDQIIYSDMIRLDPGTEIRSNTDALLALIEAHAGTAHRLENPDAELPGQQTLRGLAWQTVGGAMRLIERNAPIVTDSLAEVVKFATGANRATAVATGTDTDLATQLGVVPEEQAAYAKFREREQNRVKTLVTPENIMAAAVDQLDGGDNNDRIVMAMGMWGSMSPDEQAQYITDASQLSEEELLTRFREERDAQGGALSLALKDYVLDPALEFAQTWDRAVHTLGNWIIHTADLLPGEHEGALETLVTEGFGAFADSYKEIAEQSMNGMTVAEFLGMDEGAAASWVNFGASMLFDPFTWITPSGKFNRDWMFKQLSDPDLAAKYVRSNPAMRDLAHQLVDNNQIHLVSVLTEGGMNGQYVKRLMDIAATDYGSRTLRETAEDVVRSTFDDAGELVTKNAARSQAVDDVFETLTKAVNDGWLPSGPATLQNRQGVLGFGNVLKKWDVLAERDRSVVYQLFSRASRTRSAPITEDGFVEWASRQITVRFADDIAGYKKWMQRLYDDALDPYYALSDETRALATSSLEATEGVQRQLRENLRRMAARIDDVTGLETNIPKLEAQAKALQKQYDDFAAKAYKYRDNPNLVEAMETHLADVQTKLDQIADTIARNRSGYDELMDRMKQLRAQRNKYKDAIKSSNVPRDRRTLERFAHAFYDDWAEELGLPFATDAAGNVIEHPFLPGMKVRDWEKVTGQKSSRLTRETVDNLTALGDIEGLRAIGFGDRGWTPLPASAMEVVAYRAMGAGSDTKWASFLQGAKKVTDKSKGLLDAQQRLFVTAVLTNLVTPFKTNADEVLRFWTQVGAKDAGPLFAAFVGGTPVGQLVRKLRPVSTRARGAVESPLDSAMRDWRIVEKGTKGHWQAAERWVNGSLLEDPIFKEYSRVMLAEGLDPVMAREAFKDWWEKTGAFLSNKTTLRGQEITYQTAFDTVDNSFRHLMSGADEVDDAIRKILEAGASGTKVSANDVRFWRTMPDVPGIGQPPASSGRLANAQESVFNTLYGTPSAYRGGVFFDYYHDEALRYYRGKFKVLDEDALMSTGLFDDVADARRALAAGQSDDTIRRLVADHGYRLERDMEILAARWARNRADDMMYQMGAVSLFGRKTQRLYPFGRAQTDFLDYWWRQATQPTQLKIGQKVYTPTIAGRHIPVNVRLADRWLKLAAQADPEGQDPSGSPGWFVRKFTFLPTQFDESFLLDIIPSPSPIASWMVNWLPEDNPMREAFSTIHPSHEVFSNYSNSDVVGGIGNLIESTFPSSGRSLRSGIEAAMKALLSSTGTMPDEVGPNWLNGLVNAALIDRESPYMRDYMAGEFIDWVADPNDIWSLVPSQTGVMGDIYSKMEDGAFRRAYGQDALDYVKANVAMQNQAGSDAEYVRGYAGLADMVDGWLEEGMIPEGIADEFRYTYDAVKGFLNGTGTATVQEKRDFADAASDIFYNLDPMVAATFVVDHPEMAVNLISNFEVDMDLVPQELIDNGTVAEGRIVARGEIGREAWRRGFDGQQDGAVWIKVRPAEEIFMDRVDRAHGYAKTYIKGVFEDMTGFSWSQVTAGSKNRDRYMVTFESDEELAHIRRLTETLNVEFPEDAQQPDGTWRMTLGEFKDAMAEERNTLGGNATIDLEVQRKIDNINQHNRGDTSAAIATLEQLTGRDLAYDASQDVSYYGTALMDDIQETINLFDNEIGWANPSQWEDLPAGTEIGDKGRLGSDFDAEATRAEYRDRLRVAMMLSPEFTLADYNRQFARWFGDIDYQPPEPPAPTDLDQRVTVTDPDMLHVVDGDTIEVYTKDGQMVPFRLVGINTPERTDEGYDEARVGLNRLVFDALERGDTITLGAFDPGLFGTTQQFRSNQGGAIVENERVFGWLYIGDVPIFDPDVFTSVNPRGTQIGGTIPDYQGMYDRWLDSQGGE